MYYVNGYHNVNLGGSLYEYNSSVVSALNIRVNNVS